MVETGASLGVQCQRRSENWCAPLQDLRSNGGEGSSLTIRITDVAALAGVSAGTVSNYFNRPTIVAPATGARIRTAAHHLGYVPSAAARNLRRGLGASVGFIVLNGQNPFFTEIIRGAEDAASRRGMAILLGNSDESPEREQTYLGLLEEQRVRGVIIAPQGDVSAYLLGLRRRGIPSVVINQPSDDRSLTSVSIDGRAAGRLVAQHLIDRGHRRVAFVGGPMTSRAIGERLQGARDAIDASHPAVHLEVVTTPGTTVRDGVRAGHAIVARSPRDRPDAIFAANDLVAIGLLQALSIDGRLLVPRDIALVGFDDIVFAAGAAIPLTSVRQPSRAMGRVAFDLVIEDSESAEFVPRQVLFPPELVVREST